MRWMIAVLGVAAMVVSVACDRSTIESTTLAAAPTTSASTSKVEKIVKSNEEWKKILPAETYHVMREQGTERPFANKYHDNHAKGTYVCAACELELLLPLLPHPERAIARTTATTNLIFINKFPR